MRNPLLVPLIVVSVIGLAASGSVTSVLLVRQRNFSNLSSEFETLFNDYEELVADYDIIVDENDDYQQVLDDLQA